MMHYAPITDTVMPHPPRLVVGGDLEGVLTPAAYPLGGAFALYARFFTAHYVCSTDLTKETAPVEGN